MTKTGKSTGTRQRKFITEQGCVGIYEFARQTGYSYKYIYELCRMGRFEARYERGLWLIPNEILHRVLTEIRPAVPPAEIPANQR
jgi:hypothetical protein